MSLFKDNIDAAQKLLDLLPDDEILAKNPLIICASLNALEICDFLARKLKIDYEILFVKQIFSPINPECLIAMVSETKDIVIIEELRKAFDITLDFIYGESSRVYDEKILKDLYKYRKGKLIEKLKDRNILLVDKSCDSGMTALICAKSLMNLGVKEIDFAVPVISKDASEKIGVLMDEIYCVERMANYIDVDYYYENESNKKIDEILNSSPYYLPFKRQGEQDAVQD